MKLKIGKTYIGDGYPVFIVAEMSANHSNKLENAIEIIRHAKKIGANAIKLQTYTPDSITLKSSKADFKLKKNSTWFKYKTMWKLYNSSFTPWEWHSKLFAEAKKNNIEIFSSPFDEKAVDFLEELNCSAYKIASPEITHIPLIEKVAKTKKPIIISTGLANYSDILLAINTVKKFHNKIILLKCTSAYPSPLSESNLLTMVDFRKKFGVLVGFSDHTLGFSAASSAAALGASLIEKHIKLEHSDHKKNSDNFFSTSINEFKIFIENIRNIEISLGKVSYEISKMSKLNLNGRRSLYVSKEIRKGEILTENNIKCVRPSFGLHPKFYKKILGKKAKKNLFFGDRLYLNHVE